MSNHLKEASVPQEIIDELEKLSANYDVTMHGKQGGNGYIFSATNKVLKSAVIIKFYYWGGQNSLHAEPQTLISLKSEYILQIFDAGICGKEWAYFVTPYCEEGDLDAFLTQSNSFSNLDALDKCANVLTGLAVLHGRRLLHRDLKPANIYVHKGCAIIGDFGSIAKLPVGNVTIPASKHAVVYRPPESVSTNEYGFSGDIYQCGLVLYQLLGGALPYDEIFWLNKAQKARYEKLCYPDSTLFADDCLRERIVRGRLTDFSTVNAWAPDALVKIARRACSVKPSSRFGSAADFVAKLSEARSTIHNWKWIGSDLVLPGATSYCVRKEGAKFRAFKRKESLEWRADNTVNGSDFRNLIREIESKL